MANAIETVNENKEDLIPALAWEFDEKIIRTVQINGAHWWVAKDVCEILNLSDVSMSVSKLDDDEKGTSFIGTPGGKQSMVVINESGLYALIIRSNKPEAKTFRKWITSEVLPQIRKTGFYISGSEYQNFATELAELKKQVHLIKQSSATFNNDQSLIEPLIKQFAENSIYHNSESYPILSLIREEYGYLCDPEKYGSIRSANSHTHERLNISAALASCGIRISHDRLYKNRSMVWVDTKNYLIESSYHRTQWQGKWDKAILNINSVQCIKKMTFDYCSHPAIGIPIELFMEYADQYLAKHNQPKINCVNEQT